MTSNFHSNRFALLLTILLGTALSTRSAEKVILVAGSGEKLENAPATECKLTNPFAVDFDKAGNLFLIEMTGLQRVCKIDPKGFLTRVAGGKKGDSGDNGPALKAEFNGMHSLAVAPNGDLYVADTWNNRVRKIDGKTGIISTVIGTGQKGFSGDGGPANKAEFGGIYCVALAPNGENLYLADLDNRRIRVFNFATGLVKTIAGNGKRGVPRDGAEAIDEPLLDPRAVAADRNGNIYILERSGHALRVVDTKGKIRTVAGTGEKGLAGNGGEATQAKLSGPKHLCVDLDGTVLIADSDNHMVRRYSPRTGRITLVAGTGKAGQAGIGGPADEIQLNQPHGVHVHPSGTIFIADSSNHRLLKTQRE